MITPLETNGIVSHTQDLHIIKHNEDSRNDINYQQAQTIVDNREDENSRMVISSRESDRTDTRHDAREEGKNKYTDLRNKNKKKPEIPEEGMVMKKFAGGFDLRI